MHVHESLHAQPETPTIGTKAGGAATQQLLNMLQQLRVQENPKNGAEQEASQRTGMRK
jgi:hypothetical protein